MTCSMAGLLRHFNNRISEVATSLIMVGLGVQIIVAPLPSDYHSLDALLSYVSGDLIAWFFILIGSARFAALIANGHWEGTKLGDVGPWMRSIGALFGAVIWSQMFLGLVAVNPNDLTSLGAPIYFVFTLIEFASIYRALAMRGHHGRRH